MRAALSPPVHHHTGLRKSEGQESTDGIERDEPIGDAAKKNDESATEHGEDNDAVRVDKAPAAVPESMRKVIVLRDGAAEARKIGEGGVGGEREDDEDRGNGQIVEISFAEDGGDEHGKKALVPGLAGIGCGDAVSLHEIGNSGQQHGQDKNNHGEGALCVFHSRLAEGLTPLLTASTPVSAVQPLAKTLSSSQ